MRLSSYFSAAGKVRRSSALEFCLVVTANVHMVREGCKGCVPLRQDVAMYKAWLQPSCAFPAHRHSMAIPICEDPVQRRVDVAWLAVDHHGDTRRPKTLARHKEFAENQTEYARPAAVNLH